MNEQYKAWSIPQYGGPRTLTPVKKPIPIAGKGEVLIRVRASAVSRADTMMRSGTPRFARLFLGMRRPKQNLVGTCLSGEIIATGPDVTRFAVGDAVFGETGLRFGANASHICLDENGVLMHKPDFLSHEEASVMCDGCLTSWNFLHRVAGLRAGEKLLVLGASGSLGSAAVQIAAALGAQVTGSCSSRNAGLVAALGASRVIDYAEENFAEGGLRYDVIFDTLGVSSFGRSKAALAPSGRYICPVLSLGLLGSMLGTSVLGSRKALFSATGLLKPAELRAMLGQLLEMVKEEKLRPVMDRTWPLDDLVEAHRYVETGRKRGNVVVT